jgi:hypothetical protein
MSAGMFTAAYMIFSLGLTKPLQMAMFPTCFATSEHCSFQLTHVQNYIQLCGIIFGEWGSEACATAAVICSGSGGPV